jgi:hypothetical protein
MSMAISLSASVSSTLLSRTFHTVPLTPFPRHSLMPLILTKSLSRTLRARFRLIFSVARSLRFGRKPPKLSFSDCGRRERGREGEREREGVGERESGREGGRERGGEGERERGREGKREREEREGERERGREGEGE